MLPRRQKDLEKLTKSFEKGPFRIRLDEYKFYDINYGIVGRVIKSKEIIGYKSLFNVKELNTLIELT